MNFIIARPTTYFVICFCVLFVSACSVTTHLNLYHPADTEKKSPLSSIPSKTILLQVEDHRPSDSRDVIGYKWNPLFQNSQGGALKSERPVTDVLYDALLSEFKQNSHEISMGEADGYEMLIKVRLKKFRINNRVIPYSLNTALISTIIADIDVIKAQSGDALLTETINTIYQVPFNYNQKSTYQNALNDAIKEFIRDFSFNSNILDALNNTGSRGAN